MMQAIPRPARMQSTGQGFNIHLAKKSDVAAISMHHAVEPRIRPLLSGVLPYFPALLEIRVAFIALVHAMFQLLVAGAGREDKDSG